MNIFKRLSNKRKNKKQLGALSLMQHIENWHKHHLILISHEEKKVTISLSLAFLFMGTEKKLRNFMHAISLYMNFVHEQNYYQSEIEKGNENVEQLPVGDLPDFDFIIVADNGKTTTIGNLNKGKLNMIPFSIDLLE